MRVNGGTENDTVANWGGPAACGGASAAINVTVPADTPSADTVYLSGNYDVLGTGIPSADDWVATDYPMIKTGTDTWTLTVTGVPDGRRSSTSSPSAAGTSVEQTATCGKSPTARSASTRRPDLYRHRHRGRLGGRRLLLAPHR